MNDATVKALETIDRIEHISARVATLPQCVKDSGRIDDYVVTLLGATKVLIEAYLVDHDRHKLDLANELSQVALAHVLEGDQ